MTPEPGSIPKDNPNRYATVHFAVARGCQLRSKIEHTLDKDSGQWKDGEPLFMSCTAWRELAEHAAESLAKGARVMVMGRLKLSKWETEEGEKRSAYGLDVDEIGPSLRFATATVTRMARTKSSDGFVPQDDAGDPWASASKQCAAMVAA